MFFHIPVLLKESIELLSINDGDSIIDATFGGGGHTVGFLESNKTCSVIGIDRDIEAKDRADKIKSKYPDRFSFWLGKFSEISISKKVNAIFFDFGTSSLQLNNGSRGFSFLNDGPLDMRMSQKENTISALEVVNTYSEKELSDIIFNYGEEKKARKIAKNIVEKRKFTKIDTTFKLKNIIDEVFKYKKISKIENATKTFQAIRIYVNDELHEIDTVLKRIPELLNNGGRIVTIAFHSLEDSIVKSWYTNNNNIKAITKKAIKPTLQEIRENPRARSAIMRGFIYQT